MVLVACFDFRIDGSDDDTVNGSGVLETREFAVTDFHALEASLTFDVALTRSDEFTVAITADDNIIEHVSVEVVGRTLRLGLKGTSSANATTLRASIGMPTVESLALRGASRVDIGDFGRLGKVAVELSGASLVTGSLEAAVLELHASGASHAHLVGSAEFSGASHAHKQCFNAPAPAPPVPRRCAGTARIATHSARRQEPPCAPPPAAPGHPGRGRRN